MDLVIDRFGDCEVWMGILYRKLGDNVAEHVFVFPAGGLPWFGVFRFFMPRLQIVIFVRSLSFSVILSRGVS